MTRASAEILQLGKTSFIGSTPTSMCGEMAKKKNKNTHRLTVKINYTNVQYIKTSTFTVMYIKHEDDRHGYCHNK